MDNKQVVFIVDADESLLEIYREKLKRDDRLIFVAKSAEEAFSMANRITPHAIVLDIGLPDLSGLAFIRTVFKEKVIPEVPLFIVSGYGNISMRIAGFVAGAARYFVKPVDMDDLDRAIDEALDGKYEHIRMAHFN